MRRTSNYNTTSNGKKTHMDGTKQQNRNHHVNDKGKNIMISTHINATLMKLVMLIRTGDRNKNQVVYEKYYNADDRILK